VNDERRPVPPSGNPQSGQPFTRLQPLERADSAAGIDIDAHHEEIVAALKRASRYGSALSVADEDGAAAIWERINAHVQKDRGSSLLYFSVLFPVLRKVVQQGFSFYALPEERVLAVWDELWRRSPYGEVLFAALEYYIPRAKKGASLELWPVVRHWIDRVDNWCHSDNLSALYSWLLAADEAAVYPQLQKWNESEDLWPRRISVTSLVHGTGKTAAFLPPEKVLPLVSTCLQDHRYYIDGAVGWVLRDMGQKYPEVIRSYLEANAALMSNRAFSRAIERRSASEQADLRQLRSGILLRSDR
jgi:3-methyladenine DNA glycosylase AlkD